MNIRCLFIRKHLLDILFLRLVDGRCLAEFSLSFASFFSEEVTFTGFFTHNFTGSSLFEPFFSPTVRFHLWHSETPI